MTSRELLRWTRLYERRSRQWFASPLLLALGAGVLLAVFVAWRARTSVDAASTGWLACAVVAAALAFMRVPFHLYWRSDAALLAQLPIGGGALFDAALVRCVRAAAATVLALVVAAIPLALLPAEAVHEATRQITATPIAGDVPALTPLMFALHHAAVAGVLGLAAGLLVPGVVIWAASLLVVGDGGRAAAVAVGIATVRPDKLLTPADRASAGAILGAIPGAAGALIIVTTILSTGWLFDEPIDGRSAALMFGVSAASLAAAFAARRAAPRVMATILRDVSALDRQRLAHLEIHPPTALERALAAMLGAAGLPYRKDARLMRRRYPMAFALGALIFITLAIMGLAHPSLPWLVAVVAGAVLYAGALTGRLARPPIELPRLSATLPITGAARRRAKLAWIVSWSLVFVLAPLAFALLRLR
jgi:hypothetical protein